MSEARIAHTTRLDATPDERAALARIYRRAIERYREKQAAAGPSRESDEKGQGVDPANRILPQQR